MSQLIEIILDLLNLPSWRSRDDRSVVGESRLDKQARLFGWIFYGILALLIVGALAWLSFLRS